MPDDALTTALTELGRAYELAVWLRKASADVQTNALAMEQAMWRCLSVLRRLGSTSAVAPTHGCVERRDADDRYLRLFFAVVDAALGEPLEAECATMPMPSSAAMANGRDYWMP